MAEGVVKATAKRAALWKLKKVLMLDRYRLIASVTRCDMLMPLKALVAPLGS